MTMSHEPLVNHFFEDSFNPNHVETTAVCTIPTYMHFAKTKIRGVSVQ